MSTEPPSRRARARKRRSRAFVVGFAAVVAVLALVGAAGAAVSTAQGPRMTDVQVDPLAAVQASGARLILTTSQSLRDVEPDQVTIEPATPFAVDTSGRSIGIRFALPLWDDTRYTVTIDGVQGVGGGPAATLEHSFRTAAEEFFLLQRGGDGEDDTIFRSDLSGERAVPVFRHPHIEDYRETSSSLVVSVRDEEDGATDADAAGEPAGTTRLIATDLDGGDARDLPLPGDGIVTNLQSADRGDLIGFTFTDADIGVDGGRESMLFTLSLKNPDAGPRPVEVAGADSRVVQWRFVPETDRVLFVGFDGAVWLTDPAGEDAATFGTAVALDDVAGTTAIIDRADGVVALDLTDGSERPLVASDAGLGQLRTVVSIPGGGTVRLYAMLGENGIPGESVVAAVGDDGSTQVLSEAARSDAVIRTCVSPNGRYAAVVIAPDIIDNPYDTYLLPFPTRTETHIVEISSGDEIVPLSGFNISWCRVPAP